MVSPCLGYWGLGRSKWSLIALMWLRLLLLLIFRITHKQFSAQRLRSYCQEVGVAP
ncbi:hypothetical protein LINPERHAP2_LOCUS34344 [Linum perenne]